MAECFWTDMVGVAQEACGAADDIRAAAFVDENIGVAMRPMVLVRYNNGSMPYPVADGNILSYARVIAAMYYEYGGGGYNSCFITQGPHGFNGLEPNFANLEDGVLPPVVTTELSVDLIPFDGVWTLLDSDYSAQFGATKFTVDTSIGVLDWWVIYDNCF